MVRLTIQGEFVILRQIVPPILFGLGLVATVASGAAAQAAIEVVPGNGKTLSVALAGLPRQTATADDHGTRITFEGVLVRDVLAKAGVPLGEKLHGPTALTSFVLATARDSHKVIFSIAELDAGFTDQIILLADRRDGKPLDANAGPLQIVVPHEKRAGRWIRQVNRREVRQAK